METPKKDKAVLVSVKNAHLYATLVRPAETGIPEEDKYCVVTITEQKFYCRPGDLEPLLQETTETTLKYQSHEWLVELQRFSDLTARYKATPQDKTVFAQLVESGSKVGFFIPIK
jgi:hypothetical protein